MNTSTVFTLFPQLVISRTRQPFAGAGPRAPQTATISQAAGPKFERRDLASLLRLVTWIFQPLAKRKQLELQVNAPVAGLTAVCDEIRVQRVLETLLTNAINFSPPHSTVVLSACLEGNSLRFTVEDEGAGISPEEQDTLFESVDNPLVRFISEDCGEDNELAACRRIVATHGGAITMHNRAEGGARFEFSIPSAGNSRTRTTNVA